MSKRECPFDEEDLEDLPRKLKVRMIKKNYTAEDVKDLAKERDKSLNELFGKKNVLKDVGSGFATGTDQPGSSKNEPTFCSLCAKKNPKTKVENVADMKCSFCEILYCNSCCENCIHCNELVCSQHALKFFYPNSDGESKVCYSCVRVNADEFCHVGKRPE